MKDRKKIQHLDNLDTEMINTKGWKLKKIFVEDINKADKVYEDATNYTKPLTSESDMGMRSITIGNNHFIDVYRKKE